MGRKTILISGISSGIGLETAKRLQERGHEVFGISRHPPPDPSISWDQCDVRDPDAVRRSVNRLLAEGKSIDAIVCNAGLGHFGSIEETPEETARILFNTNYFGVINLVRASLEFFRSQQRGRIIIIGSLAGRAPLPFQAHYSASKAAIEAFSFSLHMETAPFGISVSLIEPGDIQTSFNDNLLWEIPGKSAYGPPLQKSAELVHSKMSRAPGPGIVADLVIHILNSPKPKLRYPIGPESRLVPLAKRIFPDSLNVMLIKRSYGLKT